MNKIKYIVIIAAVFFQVNELSAQMVFALSDTTKMPEIFLDEITVMAPKERTTVRELPGSVSVITSRAINEAGIKSVKDITSYTPNFFMPDYGSKLTSPVYIRGIGSRINEPSVGMYVDNAPYFDKATYDVDLYDIERIEVLRGPQGTLYGRNTMGGIINIITRSPMDFTGTQLKVSAGSYGQYLGQISHFARPHSNFAYSLSANYRHANGFFTNEFNNEKVDYINSLGFRNRLIWKVNERLTAENILGVEFSRQGGYPYSIYDEENPEDISINQDHPSTYDRDLVSNGLLFNYKTEKFDFLSTTSYQYLKDRQDIDQDFTANPLFVATQDQLQDLVSQEFMMKSNTAGRYEWLVGAFGFYQDLDRNVVVYDLVRNMTILRDFTEIKQGFALFHQSTINNFPIKNLSLVLGLRYDLEANSLDFRNDVLMNENPISTSDTLYPSLEFSVFSPKVALNYFLSQHSSVYALVSRGYKTGGFNPIFEREEDLMYYPEFSWNYEAGFKTAVFQQRLQAEVALFYIDWSDQQIYQTVPSGRGAMLKNAGKSVSKGFEISTRSRITQQLEAIVTYGYTHATFTEHVVNETTDYSGNFIPYVPRHTLAVQLNQTFTLPENTVAERIKVNLLYRGIGKHYWNEQNSQAQSAYGLLDMRLRFERKRFGLDFWVKNLLNQDYQAFYFEAIGNRYYQPGKPVNFGTNLTLSL